MGNYESGLYGSDIYSGTTVIEEIIAVLPFTAVINIAIVIAFLVIILGLLGLKFTARKK